MMDEIDKQSREQACFIDIQIAFDTLDHDILLTKVCECGTRDEVNSTLRSYLGDRVQYLSLSAETISCQNVEKSFLGSLLILLYINDITKRDINMQDTTFC